MYDELNFRESRLGFKGVAAIAIASAGVYALIAYGGELGLGLIAGATVGYLSGYCAKR